MGRLAAVTGASGFLGGHIVEALLANGWQVRALVRADPPPARLRNLACVPFRGGLDDEETLDRLVAGTDAVVHAAGCVKALSREEFFAINEAGTARLAAAVGRSAPNARLIILSSMAAREPALSDYAASKRAAEAAAVAACGSARWVILRPSAVYGPWDRETLPIFKAVSAPFALVPDLRRSRICLVHSADAADAVVRLCDGGPSRRIFEISDERHQGYEWREIIEEAARAVGRSPRLVSLPDALVRFRGAVCEATARLTSKPTILTTGKVRELLHPDWASDRDRQLPAEIWKPRTGLRNGFSQTVDWYRRAGWLDGRGCK